MTLQQLKTKANNVLGAFADALQIKQTAYFLKHGKFFQLNVSDPVVDGVDATWIMRKPNDELHELDVDFEFNSPVPFAISVDEWTNPDGAGYSITATVELPDGRRFTRSRTSAPVIEDATFDTTDPQNLVEITPRLVSSYDEVTTPWTEVIEQE